MMVDVAGRKVPRCKLSVRTSEARPGYTKLPGLGVINIEHQHQHKISILKHYLLFKGISFFYSAV